MGDLSGPVHRTFFCSTKQLRETIWRNDFCLWKQRGTRYGTLPKHLYASRQTLIVYQMRTSRNYIKKSFLKILPNKDLHYKWYLKSLTKLMASAIECHQNNSKAITLANDNRLEWQNEPIRTRSKDMKMASSARICVRASHDWFWMTFC